MRFLSIYKTVETNEPPAPEMMARMGELIEQSMRTGELVATEGCLPSALGARVRRDGTKVTVTDGPFTEAKELIAGFAILQADSKEHAVEIAKRFLEVAGGGECELRRIFESPEQLPDFSAAAGASAVEAVDTLTPPSHTRF
jgi:hypothetical protein